MTYVDFAILAILLVSSAISVVRGFVKEAISLATWIVAVIIALLFAAKLAILLPDSLENEDMRRWLSAAALFMLTLLVGGLINFLLGAFVERSGLTGTDRALGVVFGLLRGVVVVAVLVLVAGLTPLTGESVWTQSLLVPHFEVIAVWIKDLLPVDMAGKFQFSE